MAYLKVLLATLAIAAADKLTFEQRQRLRNGRQFDGGNNQVNGGVDFSGCQPDPDTGFCCVEREETVTTLQKDPILECTHKNVEKCHYTYVTTFSPAQEEVCEENFEKSCQVTFKQEAVTENIRKCYRPLQKQCNGQGPEECRTLYESSCTTRYIEKQPGKFVGDTTCEKLPVEICGAGCVTEEGPEECHEKSVDSLVDVPEETCDLNPQRTCRLQTKLVPSLKPKHECTIIPQETCNLKFTQPQQVDQPLKTRWCLDPTPSAPGESYEESATSPPVITSPPVEVATERQPQPEELPGYEPPIEAPPTLYNANEIGRRGRQQFQNPVNLEVPAVNGFVPFQSNQVRNQVQVARPNNPFRRQQRQRQGRRQRFGQRRQQQQQFRRQQQQRQFQQI